MHEAMLQRGLESPYTERLAEWEPDLEHDKRITTRVPCAEFFPVRDRALIAHATQIDPEGAWFAVPLDVHQEAWPTEDYELVHSLVESRCPRTTCSPVFGAWCRRTTAAARRCRHDPCGRSCSPTTLTTSNPAGSR